MYIPFRLILRHDEIFHLILDPNKLINNFGTKISANDENHEEINLIKTTGIREQTSL